MFYQNRLASLYDGHWTLKSPKTNTLGDGLIDRISSILDEIESKTMHKGKEGNR